MSNLGPTQGSLTYSANPVVVANQGMPRGGQMAVPIIIDFTAHTAYKLDFTISQWTNKINSVQSAYIDNSNGLAPLLLTIEIIGQTITIPSGAQAYVPLVAPSPPIFDVSCSNGAANTLIIFLNVPMPLSVWFPGGGQATIIAGASKVNDVNTAQALTGIPLAVAASPLTLVSRSTITVSTTSTQLMPGATWRKYLFIQAPQTADVWINPIGGTAGINATDCIKIPAGGSYESYMVSWTGQINYYCATGSLQLNAFEG